MVGRTNKTTGVIFAGCSTFPACTASRSLVSYDDDVVYEDDDMILATMGYDNYGVLPDS